MAVKYEFYIIIIYFIYLFFRFVSVSLLFSLCMAYAQACACLQYLSFRNRIVSAHKVDKIDKAVAAPTETINSPYPTGQRTSQ